MRPLLAIALCAGLASACDNKPETTTSFTEDGGTNGDAGRFDVSVDGQPFQPGAVRMAVPAYFPPGAEWDRLIAAAPTVGMIVFNPANGPVDRTTGSSPHASDYTDALARAQQAGITVLGYVATAYGARPESDIVQDINDYYDLYKLSGIYFAEGPMDADCMAMEEMYKRIAATARARDARAYLAVGTRFCPTYIYFFDLMVQFARNWPEYMQDYAPPPWMPANSPQRFVHFVHSVPRSDVEAALSREIGNGAGWVFATDGTEPNPWAALPSYFDEELATLKP
jgi:hypothetical protein